MVGQLNERIKIKSFTKSQDAGGGTTSVIDTNATFELWAKVENRTGQASFTEGQRADSYDYKIKVRFYKTKTIDTKNIVEYKEKDYAIISTQPLDEGKQKFIIIRCTKRGS